MYTCLCTHIIVHICMRVLDHLHLVHMNAYTCVYVPVCVFLCVYLCTYYNNNLFQCLSSCTDACVFVFLIHIRLPYACPCLYLCCVCAWVSVCLSISCMPVWAWVWLPVVAPRDWNITKRWGHWVPFHVENPFWSSSDSHTHIHIHTWQWCLVTVGYSSTTAEAG